MPFQIIRNDITKVKADVVVNTANPKPIYGSGTDAAIYEAAGAEELLKARQEIGDILVGQVAVTPAFALQAKYIIHTVGPLWHGGEHNELNDLYSCYANSLATAKGLGCESIAFPLISTGVYGFPKDEALQIAMKAISKFLLEHDMNIMLVVFDKKSFSVSGKIFAGIKTFIDENYVSRKRKTEYQSIYEEEIEKQKEQGRYAYRIQESVNEYCMYDSAESVAKESQITPPRSVPNLDDIIGNIGETFQEKLLRLVDEKGLTDVEVYKKANIDRKLFSKIRCNADYKPKKKTAVALALALELNVDETIDLLARAEIALSPSSKFDLIIQYFISQKIYDIYAINMALFEHNQQILGG